MWIHLFSLVFRKQWKIKKNDNKILASHINKQNGAIYHQYPLGGRRRGIRMLEKSLTGSVWSRVQLRSATQLGTRGQWKEEANSQAGVKGWRGTPTLQREQGLTRGWEFIVFIRHWRKEGMRSMLFSPGTKKRNLKDTSDVSIVFYCLDFPGL